jgi:uncharacterized membrane protein
MTVRRVVLAATLMATTALTVGLGVTDPTGDATYPTRFLVWNLFLAWIPLGLALWLTTVRRRWATVVIFLAWLAFLPNAPYLVTDLVHLNRGGNDLWRHVLQFGFAAWTGTLLGVVSMRLVHDRVEQLAGRVVGWCVVVVSVGLCAIGVVIGRFQRWNSWDLITRPSEVAATTIDWVSNPITNVRSTGVAIAIAAFFGLAYLTVWALATVDGRRVEARR